MKPSRIPGGHIEEFRAEVHTREGWPVEALVNAQWVESFRGESDVLSCEIRAVTASETTWWGEEPVYCEGEDVLSRLPVWQIAMLEADAWELAMQEEEPVGVDLRKEGAPHEAGLDLGSVPVARPPAGGDPSRVLSMNPEERFVRLCRKHRIEVQEIPGRTYAVHCRLCVTTAVPSGRVTHKLLEARHWGTWDRLNQCWWGEEAKKKAGKGIAPLLKTIFGEVNYAMAKPARPRAE